jgi:tetratricopeptide (TPR) repeat protein
VTYDREVTRNLERAQQTCELWSHTYPRDADAHVLSSGFVSQGVGNYQRSVEEATKGLTLNPDHGFAYANLAASYLWLDRYSDAENAIRRASERKLDVPEFLVLEYYAAFQKGDIAAMERQASQARGKSGAEDWLEHAEAQVLARSGKLEAARNMAGRAADVAQQVGQRERAATYHAATAIWEGFFGNAHAARQNAQAALKLSKGRDVQYAVAFALAVAGEQSTPEAIANDLAKRYPEDTSVRFTYVPTLRAMLARNRRAPAKALISLSMAAPYELAVSGITFFGFFGGLYPAYVRGQSYLDLHQGAKAAAEFQKILDHSGIVAADPISALAHLQMGRAWLMAGEKEKARAAYERFLLLWKDADGGVPILKQAKAEYAKVR